MENVTDMKFKKKLIMFSEKEYNRALKVSREKLSYLMQAIEWASNHIEVDDAEVFANDMLGYFARRLAESKPELVKYKRTLIQKTLRYILKTKSRIKN